MVKLGGVRFPNQIRACRCTAFDAIRVGLCGLRRAGVRAVAGRGAVRRRPARAYAIAMHGAPALPADFTHMPYANPDAPKGGRLVWGLPGTFDSLNPLIVRGLARSADPRLCGREPDGARQRRAVHALRPAGQNRRDRRRQKLRHLPSRSPRALLGRQAGHGRRRAVFMGTAARQGPPQPPPVLCQGDQGRSARPAHGAVRSRRRQRPRTAADPRPDADLAQSTPSMSRPSKKPR